MAFHVDVVIGLVEEGNCADVAHVRSLSSGGGERSGGGGGGGGVGGGGRGGGRGFDSFETGCRNIVDEVVVGKVEAVASNEKVLDVFYGSGQRRRVAIHGLPLVECLCKTVMAVHLAGCSHQELCHLSRHLLGSPSRLISDRGKVRHFLQVWCGCGCGRGRGVVGRGV